MTFEHITAKAENGVGILTIDRPDVLNALDLHTLHEVERALEKWRRDEGVRVVIITGAGEKSFASGADIGEINRRTMMEALRPNMTVTYRKIELYDKPTIAAINGYALGGGFELALSCDIRIASDHAKMGLPEASLGIMPGAGGTQRLARIAGKGKALELILTGDILTAEQAEAAGLVSRTVPREHLLETAKMYADKMKAKAPLALRLAKAAVHYGYEMDVDAALYMEKLSQTVLMGSEDKREGTAAFLEKRKPRFKGR
ncbi:enoyl-CoA hydratase/isomerase family protein [Novibacillus thermophilus]|uniref:Enoyl-CoA hydratase n=1 Tax=Novibacillus thermophilus TaxID=1471761 RepID=A0A1U9K8H3_9BACL|nr:enoyl-CoA hydratase-related protein [Novibacillus thermophilus]AQS56328.1 enoyl-CoA hydratase [Novibacillus thermophilus]